MAYLINIRYNVRIKIPPFSPQGFVFLVLTFIFSYDILTSVDNIIRHCTEEYPSPAEGIGLENRQAG